MTDRGLLKLCLFCSVIGLAILFIGVQMAEAEIMEIGEIDEFSIGRLVSVEGSVYSRYYNGEHLFFTLKDDTGKIKVVIFDSGIRKMGIDPDEVVKGLDMRLEGRVEEYEGELEIIPERVYFG